MNDEQQSAVSDRIFGAVTTAILCIFPSVFLYLNNAGEMSPTDIFKPALVSLMIGAFLFALGLCVTRSFVKASLFAAVTIFIAENYRYLEKVIRKLLPWLRYHQIAILFLAGFVVFLFFLKKWVDRELCAVFVHVLPAVFTVILILNIINNKGSVFKKGESVQRNISEPSLSSESSSSTLRNVYYFIFDEYAGFQQMSDWYGVDSSDFKMWLTDHRFSVSESSRNESLRTDVVTTNLMNLDYICDYQTADKDHLRWENPLFALLRKHGYELQGGPGADFYGLEVSGAASSNLPQTIRGETVSDLLLRDSLLYPFFEEDSNRISENTLADFNALKPITKPNSGIFTLAHLNAPHIPYVFLSDGSVNSHENFYNQDNPFYYVQYYRWVTEQIRLTAERILSADPDAVIVLQSDHGSRFGNDAPLSERLNILNAVYFGGDSPLQIEGMSSVNTLRTLLNELLGTNYEMLEVPEYDENEDY